MLQHQFRLNTLYLSGNTLTADNVNLYLNGFPISGGTGGGGGGDTTNNYYINSGSGIFLFRTQLDDNIDKQFIDFPVTFQPNPVVYASIQNNISNDIIGFQISGVTTTGYWGIFSEELSNTGYYINTVVCNSDSTGLATTVIINQNVNLQNVVYTTGDQNSIQFITGAKIFRENSLYLGNNTSSDPTDGTKIGNIKFRDNSYSAFGAEIAAFANGLWQGGSYPTYLSFYTAPNASQPLERFRITSSGYVAINNTSPISHLDVSGNINASGMFVRGNPVLTGNVSAQAQNVVYTTGNQTISGVKTFSGSISATGIYNPIADNFLEAKYWGWNTNTISLNNIFAYGQTQPVIEINNRYAYDSFGVRAVNWQDKVLSGNWNTNTAPTVGTHIINKSYLDTTSGALSTRLGATGAALIGMSSSPVNVVYTTGNQTISGTKTFHGQINHPNFPVVAPGLHYDEDYFVDTQATKLFAISETLNWGTKQLSLSLGDTTLDWENRILSGNWNTNTAPTVGTHIINKSYLDTTSGALSTRLGATGAALIGMSSSPVNVVYTTGNQTISGTKTFHGQIDHPNNFILCQGIEYDSDYRVDLVNTKLIASTDTLDWGNGLLLAGANTNLNWNSKILSGDWNTNTSPTVGTHVINKSYLDITSGALSTRLGATGAALIGLSSSPVNVVYTTGNQTISGIKTFHNNVGISGILNITGRIGVGIEAGNTIPLTFAQTVGEKFDLYKNGGYTFGVESNEFRFSVGTAVGKFSFKNVNYSNGPDIALFGWNTGARSNLIWFGTTGIVDVSTLTTTSHAPYSKVQIQPNMRDSGNLNLLSIRRRDNQMALFINNTGNVGFKHLNPQYEIDVSGSGNFSQVLVNSQPIQSAKSITVEYPRAGDNITLFRANRNMRINEIYSIISGESTPTVNFTLRYATGRHIAGTEINAGGLTCNNIFTGNSLNSFTNSFISGGVWVWMNINSTGGHPKSFHLTSYFNYA